MVTTAASVEWTVVQTEVEALQLEYSWIKEFDPRFNVKYRDDKSYPWLAVTLNEEYPAGDGRPRRRRRRASATSGPTPTPGRSARPSTCCCGSSRCARARPGVFKRSAQIGRPCLLGYIGKCSAPCVGRVTAEEHREIVDDFCTFIGGQTSQHVKRLERRDAGRPPTQQEYERAARLRDDIGALKRAMEQNAVVLADGTDADVIAVAEDPLEIAVQVFYVRGGRVRGQRGWVADRVDDAELPELLRRFLIQVYDAEASDGIPREVLRPAAARRPRCADRPG